MRMFADRQDAGRYLAPLLRHYRGRPDVIVLALPRGGVPVGAAIAEHLGVAFDVFVVRKLGVPGHEELAMGAIASGGVRIVNTDVTRSLGIPKSMIDAVAEREGRELARREREYRGSRPAPDLRGRTAILTDDGLATGSTMRAAVAAVRQEGASRIVVAVPVASKRACQELADEVDEIVCAEKPAEFAAVGEWYQDFSQTTDAEVRELLRRSEREHAGPTKH
jgi:putative phosphoribosyl transferase